ncbi:MAG: universal stress protein [Trueperaceae bacterium]|nr:universal stress protein [Trueperaceae bacterium]
MERYLLVPLDGSTAAETAVWHAAGLVGALADGLLLLQVLETPPLPSENVSRDLDWRLLHAESAAYLRSVAERLAEIGVEAAIAVEIGAPAEQIVRHARRQDVVLVVMAAHGRGEAEAFAFGGTTHKVLSLAPASVMVVRRGADAGPQAQAVGFHHVLVPLDGSPAGEWALGLAAAVARQQQATLLLLHLVPEPPPAWQRLPPSGEEAELQGRLAALQAERATRYLSEMEARLAHTDLQVRSRVGRAAHVAEGIRAVAAQEGADLIALAAHGASGAPFPCGAVAQRLLATCGLPIVVFQDAPKGVFDGGRRPADAALGPEPGAEGGAATAANDPAVR